MAAVTTTGRACPGAAPVRERPAGIAGALRSEFTKIRSVRSTYWTLLAFVLAGAGVSAVYCAAEASRWAHATAQERASFDPTWSSIFGLVLLGQLVIVVLGALTITSEYSTGMIRTSLTVMPRRGVLYGAKAAVFAGVALAIALLTSFASFFLGQALLAGTHAGATLSQPDVLRAVIGTSLYVALCGLFAFGLGTILRNTAGALAAGFGLLVLLPQLARVLPAAWYADVVRWLPGGDAAIAIAVTRGAHDPHLFSAWGELAVLGGYTVILLIIGAVLFRRRDA